MKSASYYPAILETVRGNAAQAAYNSLKKSSNIDGKVTEYPGIEGRFDGFGIAVDCIDRFETSLRPTLLIALSEIYRMARKLHDVRQGKRVWRGEGIQWAHPSVYSREMGLVLSQERKHESWDNLLLLL